MDLSPFLDQLRRDLAASARTGGAEVRAAAEHLATALDPAARIVLLDALVTAADELSSAAGASVEVRLRGREVDLVVHTPSAPDLPEPPAPPLPPDGDDSTARVSLRLPETLKLKAEARAATEGISLNNWLVRTIAISVEVGTSRRSHGPGTRLTGWARS